MNQNPLVDITELKLLQKCGYYIYYIDAEKAKTVVAYLTTRTTICHNDEIQNLTFQGVARLKDGDAWDVKKGRRIARKKAIRAYKRYVKQCLGKEYERKRLQLMKIDKDIYRLEQDINHIDLYFFSQEYDKEE